MRVIFEVVHPADVLFFKRPIEKLIARNDVVSILSRRKDIACDLLNEFGFEHLPLTTAGTGIFGLAKELLERDVAIYHYARKFRPDVMIGFGGVSISHAGKAANIETVSFYDSENASLQTRITWPFISELYVPESYCGPTPANRTIRLKGTKELSFLHPSSFCANRNKALESGLDPNCDNYFIRLVSWRANHDIGKGGWTEDLVRKVVSRFSDIGRVHISSEVPLPDDMAAYAYRGTKSSVHHLLAYCRLLVGESATMASEAAVLGVPAIYAGQDFPGYVLDLERSGLLWNIRQADESHLMTAISQVLDISLTRVKNARDTYVAACPDWCEVVVESIDMRNGK